MSRQHDVATARSKATDLLTDHMLNAHGIFTSVETQMFAEWPMTHAQRVTTDNRQSQP